MEIWGTGGFERGRCYNSRKRRTRNRLSLSRRRRWGSLESLLTPSVSIFPPLEKRKKRNIYIYEAAPTRRRKEQPKLDSCCCCCSLFSLSDSRRATCFFFSSSIVERWNSPSSQYYTTESSPPPAHLRPSEKHLQSRENEIFFYFYFALLLGFFSLWPTEFWWIFLFCSPRKRSASLDKYFLLTDCVRIYRLIVYVT